MTTATKCEGCGKRATKTDSDGVPLCASCWDACPRASVPSTVHQLCPVCVGHGVVPYPEGIAAGQDFTSSSTGPWPCRRCKGIGTLPAPAVTVSPTDTERLDWLQEFRDGFHNIDRITSVNGAFNRLPGLRTAIDAEMRKGDADV
jgi:hypothetical protein